MAYQANKPLPTDRLKDSQADIQANFQSNKTAFDKNHVTFDDANAGKHKFIQMPRQAVDPSGSIGATEAGIYCKNDFAATQQLFIKNGAATEIPLTATGGTTEGWMYLPSGLLYKWGYVNGSGSRDAIQSHNLPDDAGATIPRFTTLYCVNVSTTNRIAGVPQTGTNRLVFVTLESYNIALGITSISVQQVGTFGAGGTAHDWTYIAIGV